MIRVCNYGSEVDEDRVEELDYFDLMDEGN